MGDSRKSGTKFKLRVISGIQEGHLKHIFNLIKYLLQ